MNPAEPLKVLLVEDDEDDYILTKGLFSEIKGKRFEITWIKNYQDGLEGMSRNEHDVCLVDYRLGAQNGIELLRAALLRNCQAPVILLTGQGEREIDMEAMQAGASDYLVKGQLEADLLERSVRYAVERRRASAKAVAEQSRLAAFGTEVGLALTQSNPLDSILHRCTLAMVKYLNAALARIWIYEPEKRMLRLNAASDVPELTAEIEAAQSAKLTFDLERLEKGEPLLITPLAGDPRVIDTGWVRRDGVVSYAGYPLMLEGRIVGLMSIFSRESLTDSILQEMASVANGIAMCIERKRSMESLELSEFRYQSVVENIKEVIFQVNAAGRWTFLNPAWTEITGFKVRDTIGMPFADFVHPDDRERHKELFQALIHRQLSYCRDETRYLAQDGTFRWVEIYAQPTLDSNNFGTSGTIRDITERKRAEAEIQKLAAFVRLNPDPVMELASDGTVTYLNPAARETARALRLEDPGGILPKNAAGIAQDCLRLGTNRLNQEVAVEARTLTWSFFPIIPSQVVHCYGHDTTEQMNLEAQLRHAQKLESVGQLAAGVAHDFNNILTIIQGHTDRLLGQCPEASPFNEPLTQVSAAARRASSLTRQLLMFSRKQVMQTKVLDLNAVLGNMVKMLHRLLGEDVVFEAKYSEGLPPLEADTGMMEQVIMNLSVNARDAMPKGGRLVISTSSVEIDNSYVHHHPEARDGKFVCVTVSDTGCGMPRETLERIFEPFFTTKEVGKGTGLGLATVYGIAKQHQGWVEVTSEVNVGSVFKVYLPASTKPAEPIEKSRLMTSVQGGSETILLVEDEPVLRELARVILRDYDYQVLEASTGVEALKVWEENAGKIDLLLTDMVMPAGMTGRELAEELKSRKPDLKVIYTSGYSSEVMGQDLGLRDIKFLQKPYPPSQLAQTVRECLDVS
ncbi:MAG TPA: response regulator [Candidatus Saccharimonadales bacterium]|nr:response regulator [Candidatus Saccharimonadales bacterium]